MASEPPKTPTNHHFVLLSPPASTQRPMETTPAELEAAIAALAAKKQRLRESFDRLAACSPVPIPFRWEDLDAHLSSVQSTVTACFLQLDSAASLHPACVAGGSTTVAERVEHPVEHLAEEGREPGIWCGARQEAQESTAGDEKEVQSAYFVQEHEEGKGEVEVAGASDGRRIQKGDEAGNVWEERTIKVPLGQDDDEEVTEGPSETELAPRQGDDDEAANANADEEGEGDESEGEEEEGEAKLPRSCAPAAEDRENADRDGEEDGSEEEEGEAKLPLPCAAAVAGRENADRDGEENGSEEEEGEAKLPRPRAPGAAGTEKALAHTTIAAACANMDASTLVDMLCRSCRGSLLARRAFLPALLRAADPHALVVRAVGGFLARAGSMTYRSWGNCVALLDCVPHLAGTGTAGPSADTLEQAGRLASEWKEMMVGKTGSCRDMSRLAGWGLFTFLASYNIVLEFEAEEITSLFDNLPPHLKESCIELCNRLGLIDKMTDSIHRLIGNGQPLDAIRLVCALNLTDKYPPLSVMYDHIQKAKKAAEEILSKESGSAQSLNQDMEKNVNALILSWTAVDEYNIDSVHRNSIKEEISRLLHKYADKQQILAGVTAFVSTSHQHNLQEQCQMQPQMGHEEHQQRKERELQQKTGEKRQRQLHKPQKSQQKQLQNQQEQGWTRQNSTRRRPNKNQRRKQWKQNWQIQQGKEQQQQFTKRSTFSSYSYSGVRGVPFAERARLTQHLNPHDHSQQYFITETRVELDGEM